MRNAQGGLVKICGCVDKVLNWNINEAHVEREVCEQSKKQVKKVTTRKYGLSLG